MKRFVIAVSVVVLISAALLVSPSARVIHENVAHYAGGDREEIRAVVPRDVPGVDQPKVRLVHERRCLERVTGALMGHVPLRDPIELSMYERNQALEGTFVALPPFEKQPGDLCGMSAHASF